MNQAFDWKHVLLNVLLSALVSGTYGFIAGITEGNVFIAIFAFIVVFINSIIPLFIISMLNQFLIRRFNFNGIITKTILFGSLFSLISFGLLGLYTIVEYYGLKPFNLENPNFSFWDLWNDDILISIIYGYAMTLSSSFFYIRKEQKKIR